MVWCLVCGVCNIGIHLSDISKELRKMRKASQNASPRPPTPEMVPLSDVVVYSPV